MSYNRICNSSLDLQSIVFSKLCVVKTSTVVLGRYLAISIECWCFHNAQIGDLRHTLNLHSMGITSVELRDKSGYWGWKGSEHLLYGQRAAVFIYATQHFTYIAEHADLKLQCTSH